MRITYSRHAVGGVVLDPFECPQVAVRVAPVGRFFGGGFSVVSTRPLYLGVEGHVWAPGRSAVRGEDRRPIHLLGIPWYHPR